MSNELDFNQRIINEFRANAGVVGGYFEGRTLLYGKMEAVSPGFAEYRLKAKRTIPVVVLVQ